MMKLLLKHHPKIDHFLEVMMSSLNSLVTQNDFWRRLDTHGLLYQNLFVKEFQMFKDECRQKITDDQYGYQLAEDYSAWMVAWLFASWQLVFHDIEILKSDLKQESQEKIAYLTHRLPEQEYKYNEILRRLEKLSTNSENSHSSEKSYYERSKAELRSEIDTILDDISDLKTIIKEIDDYQPELKNLQKRFVFFVRGSLARFELTFLSDIDFGYCVNNETESVLDVRMIQELIRRFESLTRILPIETAGLYFELKGEDLTRFNDKDSIYTILTILESRAVFGDDSILKSLKQNILNTCSKPKLINYLKQYQNKSYDGFELVDIKTGIGGIRHLQTSVWKIMVCYDLYDGSIDFLLAFLKKQQLISELDVKHLQIATKFYLELRNFIPLFFENKQSNLLDQEVLAKYLKYSNRFENIDQFDQQMIFCLQAVKSLSEVIDNKVQTMAYVEEIQRLKLTKSYHDHRIIKYQSLETVRRLSWLKPQLNQQNKRNLLFSHPSELLALLINIAQTGAKLDKDIETLWLGNFDQLAAAIEAIETEEMINFIKNLFMAAHTSAAIEQMWSIMVYAPVYKQVKTMLGLLIPETDQMRFVRRNTEVHEYPLCVHSLKALATLEEELVNLKKNDPEVYKFLDHDSLFALKWSCMFHDIGKIDILKDHEKSGPTIAIRIFKRFGWLVDEKVTGLIRLLVEHHQSVVKFSRLAMYPEIGINKYLELAQRDPRKVLLLYLINVSDYKSVNQTFRRKAAAIEGIYQKTMEIFHQLKSHETDATVTKIVNQFLDAKIAASKNQVGMISLLNKSIKDGPDSVILSPMLNISETEAHKLETNKLILIKLVNDYAQSFEDIAVKKAILMEFSNVLNRNVSSESLDDLMMFHFDNWNWFFSAVPNRLILSLTNEELSLQLEKFPLHSLKEFCLSIIKGEDGEYDTLLFRSTDLGVLKSMALILNRKEINIENGKINHVEYHSGENGIVGFLHVSNFGQYDIDDKELKGSIQNLKLPIPKKQRSLVEDAIITIKHYQDDEKGYIVKEIKENKYIRQGNLFHYIKVSTSDQRYRFYKIIKSMEDMGIAVKQSTITTIGNQINDYFILNQVEYDNLDLEKLQQKLEENLSSTI